MVEGKLIGKVFSAKMQRSVTVKVPYWHTIKRLQYRLVRHTKLMAHDLLGCREGDTVQLKQSRPYSKRKSHIVTEILRRAPQWTDPPVATGAIASSTPPAL
ncbi:hypothetical protein T492DRAFT_996018 [Pavlovales sp. CCMP2436]|nr:hypothetical protein T492DRAFT_996018 [Pavlovales sp. CCMP2436]